ncbi:uncharacterized protein NPIL_277401 [Nephila pilipes]|uniref:Uncharacterized protein n=1 Tax=Nephila pilipes TaxID=299642 RepID=A0A8X6UXB6_NEPPI|nr:uncharacterized protein NPIL_277401 [Nephila pilipes]
MKPIIIEPILNPEDNENPTFYLPYGEIIKSDRTVSKLRIVCDTSAHDVNSLSSNNCLQTVPYLYPEISDILLWLKFNRITFSTDMKQVFLQILIDEQDTDIFGIFCTENPFDESKLPLIDRFTRVLFGIISIPFPLTVTIKYHL